MNVIDNALNIDDYNFLKNLLLGSNFSWYFSDEKVEKNNMPFNYQFVHVFFRENAINSDHFNSLKVFNNLLNIHTFIRIKANLTTRFEKVTPFDFHTDIPALDKKPYKTAIYYLNNTDGPTYFKKDKKIEKIECVKNRLVIFDGKIPHTGATHTNSKTRVVINFNYFDFD
jgi:hypothetical protein